MINNSSKKLYNCQKVVSKLSPLVIVNRGVCLARIVRSAKKLKIFTIALYESDYSYDLKNSIDKLIYIEDNKYTNQLYLDINFWIKLALKYKAKSLHPGWGFLSENPDFYKKCNDNNLIAIGSDYKSIEILANKAMTKIIASNVDADKSSKLNLLLSESDEASSHELQGYDYSKDFDLIENYAKKVKFPLMIKGLACGGGRAIKIVDNMSSLQEDCKRLSSQALRFSNNSRIFLEPYIQHARHIECQILSYQKDILVLGTRECSVQRNFQKFIEEALLSNLYCSSSVLEKMFDHCKKIIKQIGYNGLCTMEFLYYKDNYVFLEINPRLQVEHGVTEDIFSIDLVLWQMIVSSKQSINGLKSLVGDVGSYYNFQAKSKTQTLDTKKKKHSIQARLCAESLSNDYGFMPYVGDIYYLGFFDDIDKNLSKNHVIRMEKSYRNINIKISNQFDSLITKFICNASSRLKAINGLAFCLKHYLVIGGKTNKDLILALLEHEKFAKSGLTTDYVDKNYHKLAKNLQNKFYSSKDKLKNMLFLVLSKLLKTDANNTISTNLITSNLAIKIPLLYQFNDKMNNQSNAANQLIIDNIINDGKKNNLLEVGCYDIKNKCISLSLEGNLIKIDCADNYCLSVFSLLFFKLKKTYEPKKNHNDLALKAGSLANEKNQRSEYLQSKAYIMKMAFYYKILIILSVDSNYVKKYVFSEVFQNAHRINSSWKNNQKNTIYMGLYSTLNIESTVLSDVHYFYQDSMDGIYSSIYHSDLITDYLSKTQLNTNNSNNITKKPVEEFKNYKAQKFNEFNNGINSRKFDNNNNYDNTSIKNVTSPMSAQVMKVYVKTSDKIDKNQIIAVIEAMKIEIEIRSPVKGFIKALFIKPNKNVNKDQVLAQIEENNSH